MSEELISPSPPPLPPSPLEKINDFSDRLSPMLVKELRQGLRAYAFVILFLVLQALLALILLSTASVSSVHSASSGSLASSIIFFLFSIAVLIVQPLRGMSAISAEIRGDTIDLMALTRLSSWRIVFGKWSSLTSQTALLTVTIIPYLILRYFFGGMELFAELLLLASLFIFSGVLTALSVGLSASTLAFVRAIPLISAFILFFMICGFSFAEFDIMLTAFSPSTSEHWLGLFGTYLIATFLGYFFLELATSAIAPSSENRALLKRLISLFVVPTFFISLHNINHETAWALTLLLLAILALDLFVENTTYPSIVMRPFLRFGILGRAAARFLAPGWWTGTLFHLVLTLLILGLSLLLSDELRSPSSLSAWNTISIGLGMIYFPLLLINLFRKYVKNRFVAYLILQTGFFGLLLLLSSLENVTNTKTVAKTLFFLPHLQPILLESSSGNAILSLARILDGFYLLICLISSLLGLRALSRLEKEELARFDSGDVTNI